MASSGADGCVPDLTQGSLSHVIIKSEACVPDYSPSRDGSPCMPPIQVQLAYSWAKYLAQLCFRSMLDKLTLLGAPALG